MRDLKIWAVATSALVMLPAWAGIVHDENIDGDLSSVRGAPTVIQLQPGANELRGSTGLGPDGVDLDYLTYTLREGLQLSSLEILPGTAPAGGVSFIALQAGAAVTVDPERPNPAPLLGWAHFSDADTGLDLLPQMGRSPSAIGFSPPLSAGTYSLWIQDTSFGVATYVLRLTVVAVPEPATAAMLLAGMAGMAWRARSRRRDQPGG